MTEPDNPPGGSLARAVSSGNFSLGDAIGGPRGVLDSVLPGTVFVVAFTVTRQLREALWISLAVGGVLAVLRLVRREPVTQAASGFVGVVVCAVVASRSGRAENFYLPGLYINVAYAAAYLVSILVRWPLLGVLLGTVTGEGFAWRRDPARLRAYSQASWIWVGAFVLRLVVQYPLWKMGAVGALGTARVAMGLPLFVLAGYLSYLILRRVPRSAAEAQPQLGEG